MKTWRLILDGKCDGEYNMVADWAMLRACEEAKSPPIIRLYGWETPTLSVGYSMNGDGQINRERCARLNIPVVRRPTGGRAVLHDRELTYSLVAPLDHPGFAGGLQKTFQAVSKILLRCLAKLDIPAEHLAVAKKRHDFSESARTPACFASANRFEISARDRKFVGSAQRRLKRAFLQHGSVLIDLDRELLNSLLVFPDAPASARNLQLLSRRACALNEIGGRVFSFEEVRAAFRDGFLDALSGDITVVDGAGLQAELRQSPALENSAPR